MADLFASKRNRLFELLRQHNLVTEHAEKHTGRLSPTQEEVQLFQQLAEQSFQTNPTESSHTPRH